MTTDPGELVGAHVLEVGQRESIPFITFGYGPATRSERRLVIETTRTVEVAPPASSTELGELMYLCVQTAENVNGELQVTFSVDDGPTCARLVVSSRRLSWTGVAPWWISDVFTTPFWPDRS